VEKEFPLVSIITPSYNQGRFLEDTILSVKNQDYPNLEHIVIDGGSTDNSLEILKRYQGTYNLCWISEADNGQSEAINKGFRMAKGEIIGWLNSDDVYFDRNVIFCIVNYFNKLPFTDILYGNGCVINSLNNIIRIRQTIWFSYNRLLRTNYITQPSTFFRRNVIQKHLLDENIDLPMDYEFWLKIGQDGYKFKHINKILSSDRAHFVAKSLSRRKEMIMESRSIKRRYGQKPFSLSYILDKILFVFVKTYGLKALVKLYLTRKNNLAFPAVFEPFHKAFFRQFLYLFKIEL